MRWRKNPLQSHTLWANYRDIIFSGIKCGKYLGDQLEYTKCKRAASISIN